MSAAAGSSKELEPGDEEYFLRCVEGWFDGDMPGGIGKRAQGHENYRVINRDSNKESKILLWIYACLEEVSNTDYDQYLKDGVVLCHLMNFLQPNAVPGAIEAGTDHKTKRVNIVHFLRAAQAYGVPRQLLFEPEDLLYLRHVPKVTRCLYALGKAAESRPDYTGPKLGEEPDDPLNMATQRRAGMPVGDDIYVAHVDIRSKIQRLKQQEEGHVPAPKTLSLYR